MGTHDCDSNSPWLRGTRHHSWDPRHAVVAWPRQHCLFLGVRKAGQVMAARVAEPRSGSPTSPPPLHLLLLHLLPLFSPTVTPLLPHHPHEDFAVSVSPSPLNFPLSSSSPLLKQLPFCLLSPQVLPQFSAPLHLLALQDLTSVPDSLKWLLKGYLP